MIKHGLNGKKKTKITKYFFCCLLIFCFSSFNINEPFQSKLEKLLTIISSPKQIVEVHKSIDYSNYENIFEYVPNVNPLNPNKLKRISSSFGLRFHPIAKKNKQHLGLDISAKKGLAIHTAASGKISFIGTKGGYGKNVKIIHKYGFITRYAHMDKILVRSGQIVKKGDVIGTVGCTGSCTGNHLHFEIIKNGKHIDPFDIISL